MSSFAVFDCRVILPSENVKAFKDLFEQPENKTNSSNFGLMANCSETRLPSGDTVLEFDCQNGQGIYYGWYKTEHKNMETYCKELGVSFFSAICDWHESGVDTEVWYYYPTSGALIYSFNVYHKNIDVQDGIDYYQKRLAEKDLIYTQTKKSEAEAE